jgi:hypothetical protein
MLWNTIWTSWRWAYYCSKHVEVSNVIHILQNKAIVHQVGSKNKFVGECFAGCCVCFNLYCSCFNLCRGCFNLYRGCFNLYRGCFNLYCGCCNLYCGCFNLFCSVWVCVCVGVLVICVLVFTVFCICLCCLFRRDVSVGLLTGLCSASSGVRFQKRGQKFYLLQKFLSSFSLFHREFLFTICICPN